MKASTLILLILFSFFIEKTFAQSATYNTLSNINFDAFVDKPVDSLLHVIPQNFTQISLVGNVNNNRISYLFILYPDTSQIVIRVKKYLYMNPIDSNRIWDLPLYKKETLHYVSLFHNDYGFKDALGN